MPVSNFSIAALMGYVEEEELTEIDTEPKKEGQIVDEKPVVPDEGEDRSLEKHTATVIAETILEDEKGKEMNETSTSDPVTLQRKRTSFSRLQQRMLEAKFQRAPYLTIQERNNLAAFLQLNSRQVKVWFQNRRNKWKREHKGQFLIQPTHEMKSYGPLNSGLENCFPCVVYNPFTQLYFTPGNRR